MKTDASQKSACSCKDDKTQQTLAEPKKHVRGYADSIKLALSVIGFTIIPKCPVCLAGYVALGTGIGLSLATATYLRMLLIVLCILFMAYFIVKYVLRFIATRWQMNK